MRTAAYPATATRSVRPTSGTSAAETKTPPFEESMQKGSDLLSSKRAASPPPPSTISEIRGPVRPNSPHAGTEDPPFGAPDMRPELLSIKTTARPRP